jgi:phenylalanyl-tRNA synthetase beta chain
MKISYNWLQEHFEDKLPAPAQLADLLTMHSFEIDSISPNGADSVLDVKVMPDRAHDCMSYWGIAKEVGTLAGLDVKPMIFPSEADEAVKTSALVSLKIQDENKCRRAMKRLAIGVEIGPSPKWLKDRLESAGQRSINNIVDIANFVMLETGQPVHTFDLDKISGDKRKNIFIRNAEAGEKVKTLDGREFTLDDSMLVIADDEKALDIAGIKGGADSGISGDTKNVLLSACNFDPINIRRTSKKLGLRTDASERFEKEISPALASLAMEYLSFLVKEIAGGYLAADIIDFYPKKLEAPQVRISREDIEKLLGIKIDEKEIEDIFRKLRFEFEKKDDSYFVAAPVERLDINMKEDIVEEIARIYGYEKIPAVQPEENEAKDHDKNFVKIEQARRQLLSLGYSEVYTYTFQNKGKLELANPIAEDKKYLRANLADGLKECINMNEKNLPLLDADEVKVFEIGSVFGKEEEIHVAYGGKKEIKEMKLEEFCKLNPSQPPLVRGGEIKNPPDKGDKGGLFKMWSLYPFILRDIAVWMPESENPEKLVKLIKDNATSLLIKEPKLFDKFTKEGKTSYAFKLVFQSYDKTLSDEEINGIMQDIYKAAEKSGWQVR